MLPASGISAFLRQATGYSGEGEYTPYHLAALRKIDGKTEPQKMDKLKNVVNISAKISSPLFY